jgi:hypothetical protein
VTTFTRPVALLLFLFVVGCGPTATSPPVAPSGKAEEPAHNHPSAGPHGGPLVEWGADDLHLEVMIDRPTATATVYVLGEDAKTAVPVTAKTLTLTVNGEPPTVVTLTATPQDGDTTEKGSSRFVGKHDALKKEERLSGSVSGQVAENKYTGKFREKAPKK